MEDHRSQEEADAFGTTIDGSGQTTSLARQMKLEVKSEKVFKDARCNTTDCLLSDASKDCIAHLLEDSSTDSSSAI